ncbi:hypothetical protein ACHQM5_021672 [Ranunculus cassubicifolius]
MTDICSDIGKQAWPKLLGVYGEVAVRKIREENRRVSVSIVEEGVNVTLDYRCDRVRVWVDKNGFVKQVPQVG